MSLEEQIDSLRKRYEETLKESSELKQEVGRLSGLSQASQERAALLERQLNFAQEHLSSITGATPERHPRRGCGYQGGAA
jgi:predicted nuclease with TOPRIM domain